MNEKIQSNTELSGARAVVRALGNRFALAGLEFEEARRELAGFGALAIVSALFLQLFLAGALIVLVALTWDTSWRVIAPSLAGGTFFIAAICGGVLLRRRLRRWKPFDETSGQVSRDARAVARMVGNSKNEA
ncbi:MAG: hypothetical protein SynsKO_00690 [Synoicihabitans sp.]